LTASYNTLLDGSTTNLMSNQHGGRDVCIGNVVHHTDRTHHWTTHWNSEGVKSFSVQARSDNAADVVDSATVYVDGTPPNAVTNLHSTTHTPGVWTNATNIRARLERRDRQRFGYRRVRTVEHLGALAPRRAQGCRGVAHQLLLRAASGHVVLQRALARQLGQLGRRLRLRPARSRSTPPIRAQRAICTRPRTR
jgi:hypothetical protein